MLRYIYTTGRSLSLYHKEQTKYNNKNSGHHNNHNQTAHDLLHLQDDNRATDDNVYNIYLDNRSPNYPTYNYYSVSPKSHRGIHEKDNYNDSNDVLVWRIIPAMPW